MKQVYYKQNEKFEYEFFNDKKCKEAFEFNGEDKNFYLELKEGNISPITALNTFKDKKGFTGIENVFIPYIPECQLPAPRIIKTLKDITPNYLKYLPNYIKGKSKWYYETTDDYGEIIYDDFTLEWIRINTKKIMLYTKELTSTNIKQINYTAKAHKENLDIEWVGVFTELCFLRVFTLPTKKTLRFEYDKRLDGWYGTSDEWFFDKLITTNATGLFEPLESEHLQVIDCKEIFEEYIETNK